MHSVASATSEGSPLATINGYQSVLGHLGSGRERVVVAEAVEILERDGPVQDLVRALSNEARVLELRDNEHEAAIDVSDRAIAMASDLGLPEPARAIEGRGLARLSAATPVVSTTCIARWSSPRRRAWVVTST